jgi:predicted nucleotidyltransferase
MATLAATRAVDFAGMRTTLRHVADQLGADQRTLRRAVALGTVRCAKVSPRRVELDADEEQYLRGHWDLLGQLRSALRTESNVRLAVVFGSVARGEDRVDSDVDLLVELADESWARRQRLNTRLERGLDRPVELILLRRVSEENRSLLVEALRDGRVIVDRDDVWADLSRRLPSLRRAARAEQARKADEARVAFADLTAA